MGQNVVSVLFKVLAFDRNFSVRQVIGNNLDLDCHSIAVASGGAGGQRPRSLCCFSTQYVHFGSIKREIYKFIAQQRKGDLHAGKLLLVMPAANAARERSFSALKRVKAYLRATTGDARLNYLMMLHVHRGRTDNGLTWWLQPTTT